MAADIVSMTLSYQRALVVPNIPGNIQEHSGPGQEFPGSRNSSRCLLQHSETTGQGRLDSLWPRLPSYVVIRLLQSPSSQMQAVPPPSCAYIRGGALRMMEWDPNSLSPPDSFEPRFTCQMGIITEPALLSFVNDIMRKYPAWNLEQNRF